MSETDRLEGTGIVLVTFTIQADDYCERRPGVFTPAISSDKLKDANIGEPVMLTDSGEVGPIGAGDQLLGKLISLTLKDCDDGDRLATVQVGGICRLAIGNPYPEIGNRVVGCGYISRSVSQAPMAAASGGDIARGTVLEVNGTTDCVILLN